MHSCLLLLLRMSRFVDLRQRIAVVKPQNTPILLSSLRVPMISVVNFPCPNCRTVRSQRFECFVATHLHPRLAIGRAWHGTCRFEAIRAIGDNDRTPSHLKPECHRGWFVHVLSHRSRNGVTTMQRRSSRDQNNRLRPAPGAESRAKEPQDKPRSLGYQPSFKSRPMSSFFECHNVT